MVKKQMSDSIHSPTALSVIDKINHHNFRASKDNKGIQKAQILPLQETMPNKQWRMT